MAHALRLLIGLPWHRSATSGKNARPSHRALAVVLDHATPENCLALVVGALQFEPRVIGIDGAAGEEVTDLLRAHDDIHANRVTAAHCGCTRFSGAVIGAASPRGLRRDFRLRFFANRERGRQIRSALLRSGLSWSSAPARAQKYPRSAIPFFRKSSVSLQLVCIFIRCRHRGVGGRESDGNARCH